ncbi:MAG: anti-sigma factor family protein [bacterium]
MINCKEAISRLWAYLDRSLGRTQQEELEEHLGLCRHCCGELEFAKQIRERLKQSGSATDLPSEARTRLEAFLKELGDKA